MSDFLVEDVAVAIGGTLLTGAPRKALNGVSTDTRQLTEGELFFALSGPNYDGNNFAGDLRRTSSKLNTATRWIVSC